MWTKQDIVQQAFEAIGLGSYVYDLDTGQVRGALMKLEAMVASWEANGIRIAFDFGEKPLEEMEVPDYAVEALYTNLALRLAPTVGKAVHPDLEKIAAESLANVANQTAIPTPERRMPTTMPVGAGNKPWRNFNNTFIRRPPQEILAGSDNVLTIRG
jgi:hypothetical protein